MSEIIALVIIGLVWVCVGFDTAIIALVIIE